MIWGRVDTFATDGGDTYDAIRFSGVCEPAYEILLPMCGPDRRLGHRILNEANFRCLPPEHAFARVEDVDSLSVALEVAGAVNVPK